MSGVPRCFLASAVVLVGGLTSASLATETTRRHATHHVATAAERPLTIGGRHRSGVYRVGNTIVAPGGFSAHGYGYPVATPEERREANNASIRARASGPYGYGVDGVGGLGFEDDPETGYNNPFYGNAFNSYVGYNGVPTQLAFGPGFANRHITGHDPDEDDAPSPPSPGDLGYAADPDE